MTKARAPLSISEAVTTIAGLIGWDQVAAAAGCGKLLVRHWGDPSSQRLPSRKQAMKIEAAYRAAGGEGAPVTGAYVLLAGSRATSKASILDPATALVIELAKSLEELLIPLEQASAAMLSSGMALNEAGEAAFDRARALLDRAADHCGARKAFGI